ncbi:MAG: lipase family protein [Alphaproteobacteria bacterium]|nr:lipase family protein [Alphaproteobacteria bacterium]
MKNLKPDIITDANGKINGDKINSDNVAHKNRHNRRLPRTKIAAPDYAKLCDMAYQQMIKARGITGDEVYQLASEADYQAIGLAQFYHHQTAKMGFKIVMYRYIKRKTPHYIIIFTGTEDPLDWVFNIFATFGTNNLVTTKYLKATINIGRAVENQSNVTFSGHSLGAALANIAACIANKEAVIFNGFWPNLSKTQNALLTPYLQSHARIYHYYVDLEALHLLRKIGMLQNPKAKQHIMLDSKKLKQDSHQQFNTITLHKSKTRAIMVKLRIAIITAPLTILLIPTLASRILQKRSPAPLLDIIALAIKRHSTYAIDACLAERQTYVRKRLYWGASYIRRPYLRLTLKILLSFAKKNKNDIRKTINAIMR